MTVAKVHAHEGAWLQEERLAPLTGVGVLVLGLAGLVVLEGPADRPEVNVAPRAFITYFDKSDSVVLGSFLMMLSLFCFLWFLGSLRTDALPRWLGWLSLALGLWLLVPPLGGSAGTPENPAGWTALTAIVAVPIWTAITGVVLMERSRVPSP